MTRQDQVRPVSCSCGSGGIGELSFELLNLNNIESTVVDPRPQLKLERQRRWLKVRSSICWHGYAC